MSITAMKIGRNVRIYLVQQGKEQQALAQHMNISPGSLSRKLAGLRQITVDDIESIAEFLDVPPGLLFEDSGNLVRNRWFLESALPLAS